MWPHRRQPTRLPHPWDSPGNNTGVGCHFLLQCMKVKSESEISQSCLTISDSMDCSLPGSSIHGIFQAKVLKWGAIAFSKQRCWLILYFHLNKYPSSYAATTATNSLQSCPTLCDPIDGSPPGSPVPGILQARTLEWVAISFSNSWNGKVKVKSPSSIRPPVTPWTVMYQASLSMGFSRQEYWSGCYRLLP